MRYTSGHMNNMIITMLDNMKCCAPPFSLGEMIVDGMDQTTIDYRGLSICQWMEGRGVFKVKTQERPEICREGDEKESIAVRDNARWEEKMCPNLIEKEVYNLRNSSSLGSCEKNGHFGEATNKYPNGIMTT